MMKTLAALSAALVLAACASHPTYGDADRAALQPDISAYHQCINDSTVQMINGSSNVTLLTRAILRSCRDQLQPVADYLQGREFQGYFISNYLHNVRDEAGSTVESFILRTKSAQHGSNKTGEVPKAVFAAPAPGSAGAGGS